MSRPIEQELSTFRGRQYFLWAKADPDYNQPDEFVVNIHYRTTEEYANEEIARIDTEHGYTHFHQFYREHEPTVEFDGDFWDALSHLESNWRRYARLYWEHHDQ